MEEKTYYHGHRIIQERCDGRLKCLRACPTKAIRVKNNRVTFFNDLCIDCGECINVCPQKVFEPISDSMESFKSKKFSVALPSSILFTQFGPDIHPEIINMALKSIGFNETADVSGICAEMGYALVHHIKVQPEPRPLISSFCPAVVRFIQVSYPNLVKHIQPLDVPREIIARQTKQYYSQKLGLKIDDICVVYISPCTAKNVSIKQPAEKEKSWIDGAISIKEIYNLISPEVIRLHQQGVDDREDHSPFGKAWGILGHFSQNVGADRSIAVAGISHVKQILDDIDTNKLKNIDFVEALSCLHGCINGLFCVKDPYVARHNSFRIQKKFGKPIQINYREVIEKYEKGYYFFENPVLPRTTRDSQVDISNSIKRIRMKERILAKLPHKDCSVCGSPDCETFADDCARNEADLTDCIFFSK